MHQEFTRLSPEKPRKRLPIRGQTATSQPFPSQDSRHRDGQLHMRLASTGKLCSAAPLCIALMDNPLLKEATNCAWQSYRFTHCVHLLPLRSAQHIYGGCLHDWCKGVLRRLHELPGFFPYLCKCEHSDWPGLVLMHVRVRTKQNASIC